MVETNKKHPSLEFKKNSVQDWRVKKVFEEMMERLSKGERANLYQLQRKYGYAPSSAKGYAVMRTNTWRSLLDEIRDENLLDRLQQIALEGKERNSITAIVELFKLKNRYPKKDQAVFQRDINDLMVAEGEVVEPKQLEEPDEELGELEEIKEEEKISTSTT